MSALDQDTYEIVPIGIDKQGRWLVGSDPLYALEQAADPKLLNRDPEPGIVQSSTPLHVSTGRLPDETTLGEAVTASSADGSVEMVRALPPEVTDQPLDVILPVLHGMYGEDGALQGLLEIADVAYVGCGVLAASVGMDKGVMKAAFAAAGLPQVPYLLIRRSDWTKQRDAVVEQVESSLRYPVFTKPANAGSSVGVSKCENRDELVAGLNLAAEHDRRLIVEQGIRPREVEVAVLGNDEPQASVVGEILPANEWYDYADKYLEGRTGYLIPAPLDQATSDRLRQMAVDAFKAIDGAGLTRVDFLIDKDTNALYLNEVNTFPGFTAGSMYPKLWESTGLPYSQLLDKLIELALERHTDRRVRS
jgi:D-alanine-D-alanine ligase